MFWVRREGLEFGRKGDLDLGRVVIESLSLCLVEVWPRAITKPEPRATWVIAL